jgi:hypothetical protein
VEGCRVGGRNSKRGRKESGRQLKIEQDVHMNNAAPQNLVRVANDITRAFEHACADGEFEIAAALLRTLEKMLPSDRKAFRDRRLILERLVASHATLWGLRNSSRASSGAMAAGNTVQSPASLH